jgi:hypothetical protein
MAREDVEKRVMDKVFMLGLGFVVLMMFVSVINAMLGASPPILHGVKHHSLKA